MIRTNALSCPEAERLLADKAQPLSSGTEKAAVL